MPTKRWQHRGFTLIEVMIVVAIIGLLVLALTLSMRNQRAKAEDARAKADLERLKIAFEDYYNDNNCYPPAEWFDGPEDCNSENLRPYLDNIPCDRRTNEPYVMEYDNVTCPSWYKLFSTLDYPNDFPCSSSGSTSGNYGVGSSNVAVIAYCTEESPSPTPSINPGYYACQGVVCNDFSPNDPLSLGCPISFASSVECQSYCDLNDPAYQCP